MFVIHPIIYLYLYPLRKVTYPLDERIREFKVWHASKTYTPELNNHKVVTLISMN